jgi:hypothetical protein
MYIRKTEKLPMEVVRKVGNRQIFSTNSMGLTQILRKIND